MLRSGLETYCDEKMDSFVSEYKTNEAINPSTIETNTFNIGEDIKSFKTYLEPLN